MKGCRMTRSKALALGVLIVGAVGGEYAPNLRNDPELIRFVHRLSTRYGLETPVSLYTLPMDAGEAAEFFHGADSLDSSGILQPSESSRLARAKSELLSRRKLFGWESPEREIRTDIHLSLLGDVRPRYVDSAGAGLKGVIRPGLTGNTGALSFFSEVDVWTEYRSDTLFRPSSYQPHDGIPHNLYGRADSSHLRSSDILRGGIGYRGGILDIETAVDRLRTGPAVHYPLTFSGYTPPLTYLRGRLDLSRVRYIHAFGLLKSRKDKRKYFYTHRLEVPLMGGRFRLGINEVVINGSTTDEAGDPLRPEYYGEERDWEWVYMIPFVPFAFAEHYLGDRDNAALSFDIDVRQPAGFRWYLEFFLDDISAPWTIFSDDYGNKWALTVGGQYFGHLLQRETTVSMEYCRVEPWVYTHFYGGSHRYTHFGESLGSPLGPNSDALVVSAEARVFDRHTFGLRLHNTRTNAATRGGSIRDVFQDSVFWTDHPRYRDVEADSRTKAFLGSGTVRSTRPGISWEYNPFGLFRVGALVEYDFGEAYKGLYGRVHGGVVF